MSDPESTPARRRPTWSELPDAVRTAIEGLLGDRVVGSTSHDSGYSAGLASVLTLAGGDRVFVKAADSSNDGTARLYREEARRVALLPDGVPMPAFRWASRLDVVPDDPWEVLAFDAGTGRAPHTPWRADELAAVVGLAYRIGEHEIPDGVLPEASDELPPDGWAALAAGPAVGLDTYDPWVARALDRLAGLASLASEAVRGKTLAHGDLRGDNVLLTATVSGPAALAVDWPYAARGNVLFDVVGMLPSVRLEGGPEPEEVLAAHPLPGGVDPDAVTAWLAYLTGYFVDASLRPPPPGIPHLRAFQRAQAEVCVPWLRARLGE